MLLPHRCPVSVSCGFLLLLAWFTAVNGWMLLLVVLGSAAIHELGHCLALWSMGGQIRACRLSVFGVELESSSGRLSYGREIACVLAGPMGNVLCAAAAAAGTGEFCRILCGANLVLCCFNLLPVRPLDGGRAVELLLLWAFGQSGGERAAAMVSGSCAALLGATTVWLLWQSGGNLWLLPAAVGFLQTAWRESFGKHGFL